MFSEPQFLASKRSIEKQRQTGSERKKEKTLDKFCIKNDVEIKLGEADEENQMNNIEKC